MITTTPESAVVTGVPVTTDVTAEASPTLLRSAIDERIVKLRPASTPLDQISRMAGGRHAGSMKVRYYSVDIKKATDTLKDTLTARTVSRDQQVGLKVETPAMFAESDTIVFPGILTVSGEFLTAMVAATSKSTVTVTFTNVYARDEDESGALPAIPAGTHVVRMGRAAGELDVQSPRFQMLPVKKENFCQIFKSQIEESTLQRLADKEVGWTFNDQEEAAIIDMRMCMERSFLFGSKGMAKREDGTEVILTGGIWNQTTHDFTFAKEGFNMETLVSLMRHAFTESNGSTRKVLLAGSGLIERIQRLEVTRTVSAGQRVTLWGVDFDQIISKFGTLYVVRSEVFDLCGMEEYGMVIDPEYLTKYVHIPFSADRISFSKQGVRNTEAIVLTEASCLVLRYPTAHLRLIPTE